MFGLFQSPLRCSIDGRCPTEIVHTDRIVQGTGSGADRTGGVRQGGVRHWTRQSTGRTGNWLVNCFYMQRMDLIGISEHTALGQAVNVAKCIAKFPMAALKHDRNALYKAAYER